MSLPWSRCGDVGRVPRTPRNRVASRARGLQSTTNPCSWRLALPCSFQQHLAHTLQAEQRAKQARNSDIQLPCTNITHLYELSIVRGHYHFTSLHSYPSFLSILLFPYPSIFLLVPYIQCSRFSKHARSPLTTKTKQKDRTTKNNYNITRLKAHYFTISPRPSI